nr:hypothetical protein [Mycolicibacter engbaekii]
MNGPLLLQFRRSGDEFLCDGDDVLGGQFTGGRCGSDIDERRVPRRRDRQVVPKIFGGGGQAVNDDSSL